MMTLLTIAAAQVAVAQEFDFREMEYTPQQTVFQLFAPANAKAVKVRIYKDGLGGRPLKTIKMRAEGTVWRAAVEGDLLGRFYTFDMGYGETPGTFAKRYWRKKLVQNSQSGP